MAKKFVKLNNLYIKLFIFLSYFNICKTKKRKQFCNIKKLRHLSKRGNNLRIKNIQTKKIYN